LASPFPQICSKREALISAPSHTTFWLRRSMVALLLLQVTWTSSGSPGGRGSRSTCVGAGSAGKQVRQDL
jgi:hypothetical protein